MILNAFLLLCFFSLLSYAPPGNIERFAQVAPATANAWQKEKPTEEQRCGKFWDGRNDESDSSGWLWWLPSKDIKSVILKLEEALGLAA